MSNKIQSGYLLFFLLLLVNLFFAQKTDTVKFTYRYEGNSLPVAIINFGNVNSERNKCPLLFFLHGAGERGVDNELQLKGGIPSVIKLLKSEGYKSCIIIAPQCPKEIKWVNTDWTQPSHVMQEKMTWPLDASVHLLDSVISANPFVDKDRIYVSGLSMGGFGTWELLQRYPDKFAAAIPVCGGGDTSVAAKIARVPVWAFHGKKDKVVLVNRTTDMVTYMKKVNKKVKMTIYENDGHYIWNKVYGNREVINWLFSKRKNH